MREFTDFTGKSLSEAIQEACTFFNVARPKLEIEIMSDAKSGIFGLVGAKKAHIRARRIELDSLGLELGGSAGETNSESVKQVRRQPRPQSHADSGSVEQVGIAAGRKNPPVAARKGSGQKPQRSTEVGSQPQSVRETAGGDAPVGAAKTSQKRSRTMAQSEKPSAGRQEMHAGRPCPAAATKHPVIAHPDDERTIESDAYAVADLQDAMPATRLSDLDPVALETAVREIVQRLVLPVCGEVPHDVRIEARRVHVHVHSGEDSGLLIGREGQTLASLQYLAGCMVSRRMGASVRIQIDAGDYRERQEDKLRQLALELANKVKETGRPQATRPLSAYQRRVMHMALQDDPAVQTHSKGDGGLKRIVIVPRKKGLTVSEVRPLEDDLPVEGDLSES